MAIDLISDVGILCFATVLIWQASKPLEKASHNLARAYGLPEIVKGSVIMAVSSSFPELVAIVLAGTLHGDFTLGLAIVIGSAIFNILLIPAFSVLLRTGSISTNRSIVYRETQFYLVSVLIVLVTLLLAVIYYPESHNPRVGTLTSGLAMLPLTAYLIYVYIQYQAVRDAAADKRATNVRPLQEWGWLVVAMLVVTVGVEMLIRVAIDLGQMFGTPSYFWGATAIAAATSVPDLFMSIRAAKRDSGISSLSNAIGSNVFDLLVVFPVGVLAVGAASISFPYVVRMMFFLLAATIVVLLLARRNYEITNFNGIVLLLLYLGFLIWIGLQNFDITISGNP